MWQRLGICVRNKKDNTHLCDSSWFYAVFYVRCLQFLARLDEVQKSLCTTPRVGIGVCVDVNIYVRVFEISYFLNHLTDLVHIWYSKI